MDEKVIKEVNLDVHWGKVIRNGSYGKVYKATLEDREIAAFQITSVPFPNVDILSFIHHENIVGIYGGYGNVAFMDYAECGSLHNYLHGEEQREYSVSDALNWMSQIARGLAYLHLKNFLCRSLNTKRLLFSENFRCLKISALSLMISRKNVSFEYMSPEVILNIDASSLAWTIVPTKMKVCSEQCDVYSFGIVFWELMTRKKPFYHIGYTDRSIVPFVLQGKRPLLHDIKLVNSEPIKTLIECCWNSNPNERPSTTQLVLDFRKFNNWNYPKTLYQELLDAGMTKIVDVVGLEQKQVAGSSADGNDDVELVEIRLQMEIGPSTLTQVLCADVGADVETTDIKIEEQEIGTGTFGVVYKAKWHSKIIAVKKINIIEEKHLLKKQIRKLMNVRHSNVVNIYGIAMDGDSTHLLMDYAECGSLNDYLHGKKQRDYSVEVALNWMYQAAEGIYHLYWQNWALKPQILKYILKPQNMMLFNKFSELKISDIFSTYHGAFINENSDAAYKSPEVTREYEENFEASSGVYSFGIVFWEVMSRKKPFYHLENQTPKTIIIAVNNGERPPLSDLRISEFKIIELLITSCWDQDPAMRPAIIDLISALSIPIMSDEHFAEIQSLRTPTMNLKEVKLLEIVNQGSYASVHRALWRNKDVAVKKFKVEPAMRDFEDDIKAASTNKHENILQLYGIIFDMDYTYLVMDYAACGSLYNYLHDEAQREYSVDDDALNWMYQVAVGMDFILREMAGIPIINCNLKPQNMMLFENFRRLKISDFCFPTDHATFMKLNPITTYIAPEVASGGNYTKESYVYSFGIIFWEVMSRKQPFHHLAHLNPCVINFKIFGGDRPVLSEMMKSKFNFIEHLITKCWNDNPAKRPTMHELSVSLSNPATFDQEFSSTENEVTSLPETEVAAMSTTKVVASISKTEVTSTIKFEDIVGKLERIGSGRFGVVYKAKWNDIEIAAKKFEGIADGKQDTALKNFQKEVKQLSRIDHANIVKLHGITFHKESAYLIMDYAECGTLHNYIHGEEQREYTMKDAISWMEQCIKGIDHLHAMTPKPMIHRDLKPHNLLLTDKYKILKIGDFGTVTDLATLMSEKCGTPGYIAPEVMKTQKYSEKCDVYSFGITLWEVLTRKQPFHHLPNPIVEAIVYKASIGERPPLEDIWIPDTEELQLLIMCCWDAKPEKRPDIANIRLSYISSSNVSIVAR